jgi:hypothetical protein
LKEEQKQEKKMNEKNKTKKKDFRFESLHKAQKAKDVGKKGRERQSVD